MNFPIPNDEVINIPIETANSAGSVETDPAGDTFTASSSDPTSLAASISTLSSSAELVLTPLVQLATGVTVTVSDSAGMTAATLVCDIVEDVTPTHLVLNVANATHTSQPVPAAVAPAAAPPAPSVA